MHEKAPLKLLLGESKRSPPNNTLVVALGWLPVFKGKAHLAEDNDAFDTRIGVIVWICSGSLSPEQSL